MLNYRHFPCHSSVPYLKKINICSPQFAELNDRAEKPYRAKEKALREVASKCAKNNPLAAIRFCKDDPLALPDQYQEKVVGQLKGSNVPLVELSPTLQKAAIRAAEYWRKSSEPVAVLTDKVALGTQLRYEWVIPDGRAFRTAFMWNFMDVMAFSRDATTPDTTPIAPIEKLPPTKADRIPRSDLWKRHMFPESGNYHTLKYRIPQYEN